MAKDRSSWLLKDTDSTHVHTQTNYRRRKMMHRRTDVLAAL